MTNEERDIITQFVAKFGGGRASGNPWSSVPATQPPAQALPPVDPEADQLLGSLFTQYPEARYRITQMCFVQEAALTEAQHRIQQLQWQLQQAQQQQQQAQQPHGILGGLFGGGARPAAAPPMPPPVAPQYAQSAPQPQMLQQGGSGFLGSALHTAAGVAGGLVLGNVIMDMFGGRGGMGGFGGGGFGGGFGGGGFEPSETVVNNYYGDDAGNAAAGGADPWGGAGTDPGSAGGDNWSSEPDNNDSGDTGGGDMGGDGGGGGDWGN